MSYRLVVRPRATTGRMVRALVLALVPTLGLADMPMVVVVLVLVPVPVLALVPVLAQLLVLAQMLVLAQLLVPTGRRPRPRHHCPLMRSWTPCLAVWSTTTYSRIRRLMLCVQWIVTSTTQSLQAVDPRCSWSGCGTTG